MKSILRAASALGLAVVAISSPLMGLAAAEEFESRTFFGIFEGDWFALFGLVAGGACLWCAAHLLRRRS